MNVKEIKEIADRMGLDAGKMKKNDLIRTIQRTEGNPECFDTGKAAECGEYDCLWRTDCKQVVSSKLTCFPRKYCLRPLSILTCQNRNILGKP